MLSSSVEGVADFPGLGLRHGLLDEGVVDILVDEQSGPGCTHLAHVEEDGQMGRVQSSIDCRRTCEN